jgi:hypothetical protein
MTEAGNLRSSVLARARQNLAAAGMVVAAVLAQDPARADPFMVHLASAADFAVLSGTGVTFIGPTAITGDIGSHPTPTMVGLVNLTLTGVNHADDAVTVQAKSDLLAAYTDAVGRTATVTYSPIYDLGGSTLPSGVYRDPSSFTITGTLTLDAGGDPNAVWIFQAGSTLITASDCVVALIGGAQASRVFWQVGSSATLGTGTDFAGSILAQESITLNTGATVSGGRVLALNGAVTLDTSLITVPEPSSALLLIPGAALCAIRRRQARRLRRAA